MPTAHDSKWAALSSQTPRVRQAAERLFTSIDTQHNGYIKRKDFQRIGGVLSNAASHALEFDFGEVDANGDGRLDWDEFGHMIAAFGEILGNKALLSALERLCAGAGPTLHQTPRRSKSQRKISDSSALHAQQELRIATKNGDPAHMLLGGSDYTTTMTLLEFRRNIRNNLRVPPGLMNDIDIATLFNSLDTDSDGSVSIEAIVDFIRNGTDASGFQVRATHTASTVDTLASDNLSASGYLKLQDAWDDLRHYAMQGKAPHEAVRLVIEACVILVRPDAPKPMSWSFVRGVVKDSSFNRSFAELDLEHLGSSTYDRLENYLDKPAWDLVRINRASQAAGKVALWLEQLLHKLASTAALAAGRASSVGMQATDGCEEGSATDATSSTDHLAPNSLGSHGLKSGAGSQSVNALDKARIGTNLSMTGSLIAAANIDPQSDARRKLLAKEFPIQGRIDALERRVITLPQLRRVTRYVEGHCHYWQDLNASEHPETPNGTFEALRMESVDFYRLNTWVILPATHDDQCAFAELFSSREQTPAWFISHWWGQLVAEFLKCVIQHFKVRGLRSEDGIWIAVYALRQHDLGEMLSEQPLQSGLARALQLSRGMLLVLDQERQDAGPSTPFERSWCALEQVLAMQESKLLDIVTCCDSTAQVLTTGATSTDQARAADLHTDATTQQKEREKTFPIHVLKKALAMTVQATMASDDNDRIRILSCLAGGYSPGGSETVDSHANYDAVNASIRSAFAILLWRQAVERDMVDQLGLPEALAADSWREELDLDLGCCLRLRDSSALARAIGDLSALRQLRLDMSGCVELRSLQAFTHSLTGLVHLRDLQLILCGCKSLTMMADAGSFRGLSMRLAPSAKACPAFKSLRRSGCL